MPKAQRIMPWAASSVSAFTGIDPHLETLIRRVSKSAEAPEAATEANDCQSPADREAEAVLWQDLERVMTDDSEATVSPPEDKMTPVESVQNSSALEDSAVIAPPQLNWQAEAKAVIDKTAADKVAAQLPHELSPERSVHLSEYRKNARAIAPDIAQSFAAATGQYSNAETGFTEPSPWGIRFQSKQRHSRQKTP